MTPAELQAARESAIWRKEAPTVEEFPIEWIHVPWHWRRNDEDDWQIVHLYRNDDRGVVVDWDAAAAELANEIGGEWLPCDPSLALALLAHVDEQAREIARLTERLRATAQILVASIGADGPCDAEDAARRMVAKVDRLTADLDRAILAGVEAGIEASAGCDSVSEHLRLDPAAVASKVTP